MCETQKDTGRFFISLDVLHWYFSASTRYVLAFLQIKMTKLYFVFLDVHSNTIGIVYYLL